MHCAGMDEVKVKHWREGNNESSTFQLY
jgi:hypothetical protein